MAERQIYITEHDMERLQELIPFAKDFTRRKDEPYVEMLREELSRARVVLSKDIPANVVTMNSRIRIKMMDTGEEMTYTLVFPADAELGENRISILAPIGTALLGYQLGDTVEWDVPKGKARFRIEEILYQPEAAGDYHL